jgi:hypothetical protein
MLMEFIDSIIEIDQRGGTDASQHYYFVAKLHAFLCGQTACITLWPNCSTLWNAASSNTHCFELGNAIGSQSNESPAVTHFLLVSNGTPPNSSTIRRFT